jgi:hypothetical protein
MSSILKVDEIQDTSGNNIINESSDTITIGASGDTVNVVGTLQNNGSVFAQGITEADQWRITANHTTVADITANWERNDTQFSLIGTGMTESSGIFTFPSTGIYKVAGWCTGSVQGGASQYVNFTIKYTNDNSTYNPLAIAYGNSYTGDAFFAMATEGILDVTDTSNVKVKLAITQNQANTLAISGATDQNRTYITFLRLGDT